MSQEVPTEAPQDVTNGEAHSARMKWVERLFYVAVVCFVLPGVLDIWFDEFYPAPIGPHFEAVPENGREWLVERHRTFVILSNGKKKNIRLRSLGPKAREHWIAQAWIKNRLFQTPESRAWLSRKIKRRKAYRKAKTLVVQWKQQAIDKKTRKRHSSRVVDELRIPL